MGDIKPYTPLMTIVSYTLDELDKDFTSLDKLWLLGLRALTDMNYDWGAQPKTIRLPIEGNKTVRFPADCMSINKIGLINENGEINCLKINNALTTWKDTNPNRLTQINADINDGVNSTFPAVPFYNYYYQGGVYQLFGIGGGMLTYGECRIDEKNRIIILNPDFKYSDILIEYMSSPERDNDYQVPTTMQEAIIAFIKWKLKLGTEQSYYAECVKARRRMPKKKFVLQSINEVLREATGQYLKS